MLCVRARANNIADTECLLCFIAVSDIYINHPSELMTLALLLLKSNYI